MKIAILFCEFQVLAEIHICRIQTSCLSTKVLKRKQVRRVWTNI